MSLAYSQGKLEKSSTKENVRKEFSTSTLELSYLMIPTSFGHGAEFHLQFPRKHKKGNVAFFSYGFGGSYYQHDYAAESFAKGEYGTNLERFSGHLTGSFKLMNTQGGILVRSGYNFSYNNYEYSYKQLPCRHCETQIIKRHHRFHNEVLLFKSFGKDASGVGVLASAQLLIDPDNFDNNLFRLKAGLGF